MSRFSGKGVIVTGGASGIGLATALAFAHGGAKVVIIDRQAGLGEHAAGEIRKFGGYAGFVHADLSDAVHARNAVLDAVDRLGHLDAAVNNAGMLGEIGKLADISVAGWHEVIENNLSSVFYCMKEEIAVMLRQGRGAIVNIASTAGLVAYPHATPYVASKFGIVGITATAAAEYATQGIRVNAIAPGGVDTPLFRSTAGATPEGAHRIAEMHPARRVAQPGEIAAAVLFLASDEASFITGTTLPVDGGWTAI